MDKQTILDNLTTAATPENIAGIASKTGYASVAGTGLLYWLNSNAAALGLLIAAIGFLVNYHYKRKARIDYISRTEILNRIVSETHNNFVIDRLKNFDEQDGNGTE